MKKIFLILVLSVCFMPLYAQSVLQIVCELPESLKEISGLAYDQNEQLLWAINDSGNDAVVFGIDPLTCQVVTKTYTTGAFNQDWEAIALNRKGQLFVADTGNNNYRRKSLKVYWLHADATAEATNAKVLITKIKFPDAVSKKGRIVYDFEAMVFIDGYFYFFSKTNKSEGFGAKTEIFKAAAVPGTVHAYNIGNIALCENANHCKITDAAFDQVTGTLALLSHKNIWVIDDFIKKLEAKVVDSKRFKLGKNTQKEGITFTSSRSLVVTEEKTKGPNFLYTISW